MTSANESEAPLFLRREHSQKDLINRNQEMAWDTWDAFLEATVGKAADRAMWGVDVQTYGLFCKYKVPMPADFARHCPVAWKSVYDLAKPAGVPASTDSIADRVLYAKQSQASKEEVRQAMLNTDARRIGMTPRDYYRPSEV